MGTHEHRQPGRPKATDAGRTRQLILNAAEAEFATLGPAGARMDAIAERAGVTKALVHHYFENKDHLYEIVVKRVLEQQHKNISELDLEKLPVEEALRALLKLVYLDNPGVLNLAGLLIHESLQNGGKLYAKCGGTQFYWTLSTLIKRGIAEGHFKEVDPTHTTVCIAGSFNYFYGIRENVTLLFPGQNVNDKSFHEEHFEQAWKLTIASLFK